MMFCPTEQYLKPPRLQEMIKEESDDSPRNPFYAKGQRTLAANWSEDSDLFKLFSTNEYEPRLDEFNGLLLPDFDCSTSESSSSSPSTDHSTFDLIMITDQYEDQPSPDLLVIKQEPQKGSPMPNQGISLGIFDAPIHEITLDWEEDTTNPLLFGGNPLLNGREVQAENDLIDQRIDPCEITIREVEKVETIILEDLPRRNELKRKRGRPVKHELSEGLNRERFIQKTSRLKNKMDKNNLRRFSLDSLKALRELNQRFKSNDLKKAIELFELAELASHDKGLESQKDLSEELEVLWADRPWGREQHRGRKKINLNSNSQALYRKRRELESAYYWHFLFKRTSPLLNGLREELRIKNRYKEANSIDKIDQRLQDLKALVLEDAYKKTSREKRHLLNHY